MSRRLLALLLLASAPAEAAPASGFWDRSSPDRNADRLVRLFKAICIDHLGRSAEMHAAVARSGVGFEPTFRGDDEWGPVWASALARVTASNHSHHHDGDECQIDLRPAIAPSAKAAIAALRRHRLVSGRGTPGELGATVFRAGDRHIIVRYDVPQEATGVGEADAGLTLLVRRPPA